MKRFAITTLGCKINQYESAAFASGLESAGWSQVPFSGQADLYIVNTCTVTARAGQQSRQMIRRARRTSPDARVIVTGCHAQLQPEEVAGLAPGIEVVGNADKHQLVARALGARTPLAGNVHLTRQISPLPVSNFGQRTRAALRVQDGCNNFCSYCVVPLVRGRSRSLEIGRVMEQADVFVAAGYRELVVTGINVGKYGLDLREGETIYSLLERLCRELPGIRIRLSSIEPTEINDTLLQIMSRHDNFMPHLHIPLQSGDEEVLARMNRRYSAAQFHEVVTRLLREIPKICIGCDILGGFPGESEAQADTTYQLLSSLSLAYLHVFPYSPRPGTLAAQLPGQLPGAVREQRVARLRQLGEEKKRAFYGRHVGASLQVLFERRHRESGLLQGLSENYIPLLVPGPASLLRRVASVSFDRLDGDLPYGRLGNDALVHLRRTL
ncbi:MAG: tRNA (N(6)-L-threonylcarbamoyladenosine(37)-C(2))-methylthiotransferase MtaB [Desulfobulbus propionicus]|nr:MAG: tRNA (N(6)-L-threonylcarbamoyladenosine(37)-C(2))-methylthiotransferase MtaB [Desulfobulbus propionicus]